MAFKNKKNTMQIFKFGFQILNHHEKFIRNTLHPDAAFFFKI